MSLNNVWVQTLGDGLVRADQITGIEAHRTPALTGKPSRWLLDVVLPSATGSGSREGWGVGVLHRTLVQTTEPPDDAPEVLARLLAQLDAISAAGIVSTHRGDRAAEGARGVEAEAVSGTTSVRFRFAPFALPDPGRHTGAEYL